MTARVVDREALARGGQEVGFDRDAVTRGEADTLERSTCMNTRDRGMYLHEEVYQHEGVNLQVAQIPGPSMVGFVQMGVPSCERLRSAGMQVDVGMGRKGVLGWSVAKGEREG